VIRHAVRSGDEATARPRQHVPAPTPGPSGRLELAACYQYCEALTRANHENFPVASVFLPSRLRPHVLALYAFVRAADDFADEPEYEGRRARELDHWDDLLQRAYHGEADHPIFVALADTAHKFELPVTPLSELLSAFHMDLAVRRHATWKDLGSYMSLAAAPIGRLLLYIFGVRDERQHRCAEDLARALALTNFWQDIAADLGRDRIYLPQEDLRHFGVSEEELFARQESPRLAHLVKYVCARTRAEFERARPLIELVPDQLGVEIAMFWHGGHRALAKVEARADRVFGARARLSTTDKAWVLAQALRERGAGLRSRL
jgi:hydroxysqualene synthase